MKKAAPKIEVERGNLSKVSRELWDGLIRYNRAQAGPLRYTRKIVTARDAKGRLLGGVILQSYWLETYVELLWCAGSARHSGIGSQLIAQAENIAAKRGSVLLHLNTFSFQAPRFYEKLGFKRFGGMKGSPKGHSRYFYVKRLKQK
jgi:ribosomal protein S18 acetylase RimI-like enzyme